MLAGWLEKYGSPDLCSRILGAMSATGTETIYA